MWSWLKNKPAQDETPMMRRYEAKAVKQQQGAQAEKLACGHLRAHGLTLVDANLACAQGEIDLLMLDGATLVFVEVRWRKSQAFGGASASITAHKLQKLSTACEVFLQLNPRWRNAPCRIDAVLLQGDLAAPQISWLKNITG